MKAPLLTLFATAVFAAGSLFTSTLLASDTEGSVRIRLDLDRESLMANTDERAVVKISLDAARLERPENRPPINLSLVIDRSGSMGGSKIAHAKEAALAALNRLSSNDVFSLVAYDSTVETLVSAQRVGNGEAIARAIRGIRANGGTALFGGVSEGASEVRKNLENHEYSPRIILISDGQANVGPSSPEELGRLGAALMKEGIPVTTIGLGLDFNEDLMTRLAQRSDGNTYFVESSADLSRIFAAELGDALSVVARRVLLSVTFPEGVRPRQLIGREGVVKGQRVELELNQMSGGQEKFALVEVEISPTEAGQERKIADASVTYDDALRQRKVTVTAARKARFTSDRAVVIGSANFKVQTDYAENVMAMAKDRAVVLVDAQKKGQAAKELRAKADELKQMAKTYNNTAILAVASPGAAAADRIENEGLDNVSRKTLRAESAQTKNQQSYGGSNYSSR